MELLLLLLFVYNVFFWFVSHSSLVRDTVFIDVYDPKRNTANCSFISRLLREKKNKKKFFSLRTDSCRDQAAKYTYMFARWSCSYTREKGTQKKSNNQRIETQICQQQKNSNNIYIFVVSIFDIISCSCICVICERPLLCCRINWPRCIEFREKKFLCTKKRKKNKN